MRASVVVLLALAPVLAAAPADAGGGAPQTTTVTVAAASAGDRYVGILDGDLPFDMVLAIGADGAVSGSYVYRNKPEQTLRLRGDVGKNGALTLRESVERPDGAAALDAPITGVFSVKPRPDVRSASYVGTWMRADGSGLRSVTLERDTPEVHLRAGATDVVVIANVHAGGEKQLIVLPFFLGLSPEASAKIGKALFPDDESRPMTAWGHSTWLATWNGPPLGETFVSYEIVPALPFLNVELRDRECVDKCSTAIRNVIVDLRDGHVVDERELLGKRPRAARRFIDRTTEARTGVRAKETGLGAEHPATTLQLTRNGIRVLPTELEDGATGHHTAVEPYTLTWDELRRGVPGFVAPAFQP